MNPKNLIIFFITLTFLVQTPVFAQSQNDHIRKVQKLLEELEGTPGAYPDPAVIQKQVRQQPVVPPQEKIINKKEQETVTPTVEAPVDVASESVNESISENEARNEPDSFWDDQPDIQDIAQISEPVREPRQAASSRSNTFDSERQALLMTIKKLQRAQQTNDSVVRRLQSQLVDQKAQLMKKDRALQSFNEMDQKNKEIQQRLLQAQAELKQVEQRTDQTLQEKAKEFEDQKDQLLGQISSLKDSLNEKDNQIAEKENAQEALKQTLSEKEDLLAKAQENTGQVKKDYEKKIADIQGEKDLLNSTIRGLQEELKDVKNEKSQKEKELAQLKKNFEKERKEMSYKIAFSQESVNTLSNRLRKAQARVKKLEKSLRKRVITEPVSELGFDTTRDKVVSAQAVAKAKEQSQEIAGLVDKDAHLEEKLSPEQKDALDKHYNLGVFYGRAGMYLQEEMEYLQCLRINPYDPEVHYNLAILYDDYLNKNKEAIEHYKKYLELSPSQEDFEQVKKWILAAEEEMRMGGELR